MTFVVVVVLIVKNRWIQRRRQRQWQWRQLVEIQGEASFQVFVTNTLNKKYNRW